MKLTKKQEAEIFHCHAGVGFLVYKSGENSITYTDFFIGRKTGLPCYIKNGAPVEFKFEEEEIKGNVPD